VDRQLEAFRSLIADGSSSLHKRVDEVQANVIDRITKPEQQRSQQDLNEQPLRQLPEKIDRKIEYLPTTVICMVLDILSFAGLFAAANISGHLSAGQTYYRVTPLQPFLMSAFTIHLSIIVFCILAYVAPRLDPSSALYVIMSTIMPTSLRYGLLGFNCAVVATIFAFLILIPTSEVVRLFGGP
jgi:hypothetical protein